VTTPLQPSSLLVVGKELGTDSIKDVQIAPAQATPHQLVEYRPDSP
jgi:hypothetical protein